MIKGFIEVTSTKSNTKHLVNINWIEEIHDNAIYLAFNCPNGNSQDYIQCRESYEEIKQKIKEAQCG